jgi:hypothetical protein
MFIQRAHLMLSAVVAGFVAAAIFTVPRGATTRPAAQSPISASGSAIIQYLSTTPGVGGLNGTDVAASQIIADLGLSDVSFRSEMNDLRSKGLAIDGPNLNLGQAASLLPAGKRFVTANHQ